MTGGRTKKGGFYAVRKGHVPGIYTTWPEAEAQVIGFNGAVHKKFPSRTQAEEFLQGLNGTSSIHIEDKKRGREEGHTGLEGGGETIKKVKKVLETRDDTAARVVYCDGSSRGNGQKGAVAGIGVVWAKGVDAPNLSERLPGKLQTNNRAEMYAVARILETDPHPELPLTICSDSQYTISVFSRWIPAWRARNWRTSTGSPVLNHDLITYILALIASRPSTDSKLLTSNISFRKVKAHVGIEANEEADRLANLGATSKVVKDRNFARDAKEIEGRSKGKSGVMDQIKFAVEVEEGDLLTEEELRELGEKQEFD